MKTDRARLMMIEGLFYHYQRTGGSNFHAMLFDLIFKADPINRLKLGLAYPEEVEVVTRFQNEDLYWSQLCERMKA